MNKTATTLAILTVAALGAAGGAFWFKATEKPPSVDWAFPVAPPRKTPPVWDDKTPRSLPGTPVQYTDLQLHTSKTAVDWRPEEHPPLPESVAHGSPACGFCHGPNGQGRPENASLAGLPADYMKRQVAAMAKDQRSSLHPWGPSATMIKLAKASDEKLVAEAVEYFSKQPFISRVRVVETRQVPSPTPKGGVYAVDKAKMVKLGQRIIETPMDMEAFELRDPHAGFIAYVPEGAIARGKALAHQPGPATPSCVTCHGEGLKGALGPPLAGRSPTYMARQMMAFRANLRKEPEALPMRQAAAKLTDKQIIEAVAYAATLKP